MPFRGFKKHEKSGVYPTVNLDMDRYGSMGNRPVLLRETMGFPYHFGVSPSGVPGTAADAHGQGSLGEMCRVCFSEDFAHLVGA